jgi:hypothetical protein
MRHLFLFFLLTALVHAESATMPVGRITLTNGRVLKQVVIRSYDTPSEKVLLLSEGKALLIPITLLPPVYAEKVKADYARSSADLVQTSRVRTPEERAAALADLSLAADADNSATAEAIPPTPTPASASPSSPAPDGTFAESTQPFKDHREAAMAYVRRYFKFRYPTGHNSTTVTDTDFDIEETKAVSGWTNRYNTKGRAYVEIYDSIGGGSFRRGSAKFEIVTEQKPGEEIKVIDFTRK